MPASRSRRRAAFSARSTSQTSACGPSYGDYDRQMFERQCRELGVPYPFGVGHLNVKSLFAVACGLPREMGMSRALLHLGLPLEGTHHRAGDDAWNIAAILSKILMSARAGLPRR